MKLTEHQKDNVKKIKNLLIKSFIWHRSPQGQRYWDDVVENLDLLLYEEEEECCCHCKCRGCKK